MGLSWDVIVSERSAVSAFVLFPLIGGGHDIIGSNRRNKACPFNDANT